MFCVINVSFLCQLADLLGDRPSVLDDCLQSFFPPEDMKAVLEHHRRLGHFKEKGVQGVLKTTCLISFLVLEKQGQQSVCVCLTQLSSEHQKYEPLYHGYNMVSNF